MGGRSSRGMVASLKRDREQSTRAVLPSAVIMIVSVRAKPFASAARREPDTASSPGLSIVAGTVMLTAWSRILPETSAALSAVLMRMASSVAIFFAHLSSALSDAANTNASAIAPVLAVIFMTLLR